MPLYITATYEIKPEAIEKVRAAIKEFTEYVKKNEPGTRMYVAWQEKATPTRFCHFFIFENQEAQDIHSNSTAVKKFESIYSPELVHGGVTFTQFDPVANNRI